MKSSPFRALQTVGRFSQATVLAAAAALFWLILAALVAGFLYDLRRDAVERATRHGKAIVLSLDGHTAGTFQAIDVTLFGVANSLQLIQGLDRHDPFYQDSMTERLQLLAPYVRALFIIGVDGRILHDTDYPLTPDVSLADREYFRAYALDPALDRAIGRPVRSRSGTGWFLAMTRRVEIDGEFAGVAVAAVQPEAFEALFADLRDRGDAVALYHRDGTLLARYPHSEADLGKSFASSALFAKHLPVGSAGSYITDTGVLGYGRIVSYRALGQSPLVVAMAQRTETVLAGWRETALAAVLALVVLGLLLALLVLQFRRDLRLRDLARERRAQSEKLEALGRLTGSISHDFANLLAIVGASLRVVQNEGRGKRLLEAVAIGDRAVARGSRLLEKLRSFARRQPLDVRSSDLNLLLREGGELLRQAAGTDVQLEMQLAEDAAACLLDETEFEVALVNLLVNARDAGARRVQLRTYNCTEALKPEGWRHERVSDFVCLSVTDDGPGMAEDVRRRIFEPYFSTKGAEGSGLGLAQVYGYLRQMGGDVHVQSRPGKGTTISLMFPRAFVGASARPMAT